MKRLVAALAGLSIALAAAPAFAQSNTAGATADTPIPAKDPKASVEKTTIGDLIDNPKTKAVLQQDMPALLTYDGLDQIKGMTLRDISAYPQASLDQDKLTKIQKDFDAIP
jgi:para-nitrobenzyl esterase